MAQQPLPPFKPIALADKPFFDDFLRRFPPSTSEFTFTNFFCWRGRSKAEFAVIDNHLLVRIQKGGSRIYYQPIGENPAKIIRTLIATHPDMIFEWVDEMIAQQLSAEFFAEHQRDMDDYVYNLSDMRAFAGRKYAAKRNFIKRCEELSPLVSPLDHTHIDALRALQAEWYQMRNCAGEEPLQAENDAIGEALAHFTALGLSGVIVEIDGRIAGFAIGEPLNNDTVVEHFEKGRGDVVGIYPYVLRAFARAIPDSVRYFNREQDLGLEGLRKAKENYYPAKMMMTFRIRKR